MTKVIANSQGKVVVANNKALAVQGTSPDPVLPKYTGHVDTAGLTALGWDSDDIQWLQDHVWWDAKDDAYWAVTEANLAFGPNGATPLTWANRATVKNNPDVRYFPKFDPSPSSNTNWGSLFAGYARIYALPTHGWDTQYVTSMSYLFSGCSLLHSVGDLSGWNTSKVTNLSNAFGSNNCLLSTGDLSGWDVSNVTSMNGLFQYCYNLRYIGHLSNWDTGSVTTFASTFYQCFSLTDIGDLSNWDTRNVTLFTSTFYQCYGLRSLGLLASWDTGKVTAMTSFLSGCCSLTEPLDLSNWDMSSVTDLSNMFASCFLLPSVGDLSRWDVSNVTKMQNTFYFCYYLSGIGDISGWDVSNVTTMSAAFAGVKQIQHLNIKNWDVSLVENLYQTFSSDTGLTELDLSGWDLSSCTNVGTSIATSPMAYLYCVERLKLGPHFFDGSPTTYYFQHVSSWTRDSVYESLYTNQTLRDSTSTVINVRLATVVYDSLSAQDISDIATKNITLTRG